MQPEQSGCESKVQGGAREDSGKNIEIRMPGLCELRRRDTGPDSIEEIEAMDREDADSSGEC